MRAREFIAEGMTFGVAVEQDYTDDRGQVKKMYSGSPWWKDTQVQCNVCDGLGHETYQGRNYTCRMCDGKGHYRETVSTAPELSVSNYNGYAIQEMLGLDPDYSGVILHDQIPEMIRRLIRLKNTSTEKYTEPPEVSRGTMQVRGQDQNITTIGSGPTMYSGGRSSEQVDRYIDELLQILQFAQKNNAVVNWG
jgi:hypothetical protein